MKLPEVYGAKIDLKKVNLPALKAWGSQRLVELMGAEDEVGGGRAGWLRWAMGRVGCCLPRAGDADGAGPLGVAQIAQALVQDVLDSAKPNPLELEGGLAGLLDDAIRVKFVQVRLCFCMLPYLPSCPSARWPQGHMARGAASLLPAMRPAPAPATCRTCGRFWWRRRPPLTARRRCAPP